MKNTSIHKNLKLWNVAHIAFFIAAIFCIKSYVGSDANNSFMELIINISIAVLIIGMTVYLIDCYLKKASDKTIPKESIPNIIKETVEDSINQENAELILLAEAENRRKKEEQWAEIVSYTKATFQKTFTADQIEVLLNNMKALTGDENYTSVEKSVTAHLKSDDVLHFGWNIGKRLLAGTQKKLGTTTALFLKKSFPITLIKYDIGTIPSKLRVENFNALPLINPNEPLTPYVFPSTEDFPLLS